AALVLGLHEQAPLALEDARQLHGLVTVIRRAVGLEAVDLDVARRVRVPSGLGPERLVMAAIAIGLAAEEPGARLGRLGVEVDAGPRLQRRQRELIELERRQLGGHLIAVGVDGDVTEPGGSRDRELLGVVEARIEEGPDSMHFNDRDKRIPVWD